MAITEKDIAPFLRTAADYADMLETAGDAMTKECVRTIIANLIKAVAPQLGAAGDDARQWLSFACMLCGKTGDETIRQGEGHLCPGCHARLQPQNATRPPR